MSPHGIILLAALSIGFVGKLAFPSSSFRVVAVSALALPVAAFVYFGEAPSALGLAIIMPISLVGAALGVGAGSVATDRWHRLKRQK
jgi:hypothetical protein